MKNMINFTKLQKPFLVISITVISLFWVGTAMRGWFNLGIDFQAGLNVQVQIDAADVSEGSVRDALSGFELSPQVQRVGTDTVGEFIIRLGVEGDEKEFQQSGEDKLVSALEASFGAGSVTVNSSSFVGARFAGNLARNTAWLTIVALLLILAYIWVRFKLNYAVSAIVALMHDVLFLVGFIGVLQLEVSTATVAAVLTIIGYSLNDTIVIFDRIRENNRIMKETNFAEVANTSINQSLSRTLITSITTLIAVIAIYVFSTGTIQIFALNLIVGVVVGTYSSIFIASTVLIGWHNRSVKKVSEKVHATHKAVEAEAKEKKKQAPAVTQTADEIAEATAKKKRAKEKKKKKK
ncbi:MAG: protein translocase subunit SecF [Spirochaetales bacterium]|nr:protein translocase subunit SecF [Spirochaetales bacterium]